MSLWTWTCPTCGRGCVFEVQRLLAETLALEHAQDNHPGQHVHVRVHPVRGTRRAFTGGLAA
jgi:hypothetical protein